jgi:HD-GYP domain-containing protein (c-di-GMP phosphodiesterase class II)
MPSGALSQSADPGRTEGDNEPMASRPVGPEPSVAEPPTRAELLAALSVAIDLGLGQPAEHMLRAAMIATRLANRLGLTQAQRDCVYYTTLIMWIGCHADSHEYARWFGDDIAVRHDSYLVDWSGLPYLRFLMSNVGRGQPLTQRLTIMATLFVNARGQLSRLIHSHCTSAALLADRIGLGPDVQASLAFAFERYDGGGLPAGAHGDEIPVQMRVAQLADMVEVHHRAGGVDGAVAVARGRRGGQFDPQVVDTFIQHADAILAGPLAGDAWAAALREAPDRHQRLDEQGLDALLVALGDFVDLKCPFTLGHSRAVARLSGDAALAAGVDADAAALARRAGHVHDLGRIGVSNQIWSKPASLSAAEFERVRLHPYLTVRILNQVPGLARLAEVAGNHHECLNGSGYPRGLAGTALSLPDRVLAAAVSYQSACEPRPYRDELSPGAAARRLRERVRAGELDGVAVEAVLHAAGQPAQRPNLRPGGLTPREIEVLCLVARGASNKQIAASLVISEKTARNHVERTYAKIGVSNRIGASMYALRNGLVNNA